MISLTNILKDMQKRKKTREFAINDVAAKPFRLLKNRFMTAPLLQYFDFICKIKMEINVSNFNFKRIIS
jgi:hypothetical protein